MRLSWQDPDEDLDSYVSLYLTEGRRQEEKAKRGRVSATDWMAERRSGSRICIRQRYGAMEEKKLNIILAFCSL
jgi:hypothetical protein